MGRSATAAKYTCVRYAPEQTVTVFVVRTLRWDSQSPPSLISEIELGVTAWLLDAGTVLQGSCCLLVPSALGPALLVHSTALLCGIAHCHSHSMASTTSSTPFSISCRADVSFKSKLYHPLLVQHMCRQSTQPLMRIQCVIQVSAGVLTLCLVTPALSRPSKFNLE